MKIKYTIYAFLAVFLIVMQTTVFDYIKIFGVKPNLMLVFIVCSALIGGETEGAVIGLILGFALDMVSGKLLGFNALLGMYTGLAIGVTNKRIYKDNLLVITAAIFLTTLVYEWLVYLLNTIFDKEVALNLLNPFTKIILPEALYNCIATFFIFKLLLWIDRKTMDLDSIKRK
ncbi:MAG: rod shape-determining protein MreD [Eubacteriales bacterium]|nr:rod shape-determining protein MreD [Eubacteriales bacterium]